MITPTSHVTGPLVLPLRIYYEDTDFSGSVYHASYLRFLERGRTEFLRAYGIDQSALFSGLSGPACFFAVRAMSLDFLKPAHMDDELAVETAIELLGGASIQMAQRILRHVDVLVTAKVKIALVAGTKAQRLPADLVAKLSAAKI
jgi:acyl-CoA thioester hydrolase